MGNGWSIIFESCRLCDRKTAADSEETGLVICDGCEDKLDVEALNSLMLHDEKES